MRPGLSDSSPHGHEHGLWSLLGLRLRLCHLLAVCPLTRCSTSLCLIWKSELLRVTLNRTVLRIHCAIHMKSSEQQAAWMAPEEPLPFLS